mgnify:CR=1 FL=1
MALPHGLGARAQPHLPIYQSSDNDVVVYPDLLGPGGMYQGPPSGGSPPESGAPSRSPDFWKPWMTWALAGVVGLILLIVVLMMVMPKKRRLR